MPRSDRDDFAPETDRTGKPTLATFAAAAMLAVLYVGLLALMARPVDQFVLRSPDFAPGDRLPERLALSGYGCVGDNESPTLVWRGAPATTRSFAVTMHDPDAPGGEGWWHWIVVDVPADRVGLPTGAPDAKPADWPARARELRADFGVPGYGGPCPPAGALHRYVLTVYALANEATEIPADVPAAAIGRFLRASALAKAELTGVYSRP
jgi:Raf kinase inhibitor-like YbhB/YbcL family protein